MKRINDVKMKAEYIYDLLLFHTYSKFSGFIVNLMGLTVIVMGGLSYGSGAINAMQCAFYILAGFGFLAFTPVNLRIRAGKMIKNQKYSDVIQYAFDEQGIEEAIHENINSYSWSDVEKAIATPKNIAFYVKNDSALIIPKESFGENFMPVMKLIAENITRDKIYIR